MKLTDLVAELAKSDADFLDQIPGALEGPNGDFLTEEQKADLRQVAAAEAKKRRRCQKSRK
jgi:hypothetical protein